MGVKLFTPTKQVQAAQDQAEADGIVDEVTAAMRANGWLDDGDKNTKPRRSTVTKSDVASRKKDNMAISNQALLEKSSLSKAFLTSQDFGGAGEAPLSVEQIKEFIVLMQAEQVMLPDVRTVTSSAAKWQESILDFSSRMLQPAVQGVRTAEADRTKPTSGVIEIQTVLLRGEVGVTEEVFEDTAAQDFETGLAALIADRAGADVEDLFINGDTGSADPYLAQIDGWLAQSVANGNTTDVSSLGQDYQAVFANLVQIQPARFQRGLTKDGRFYAPLVLEQKYRDALASRGTALGDLRLEGKTDVFYQGILLKGVPSWGIEAGSPDTTHVLLADRRNLYAGYHRSITIRRFDDPREGMVFWIPSVRVDAKVAVPEAVSIALNVNVEPS